MTQKTLLALFALVLAAPTSARQHENLQTVLAQPIAIERESPVSEVPLERRMGKPALNARVEGAERQFIFDTGSPSMISRAFAEELGLEIIGSNTGHDANGREVTTGFAVVDRLQIGSVAFLEVPVLVFDFAEIDPRGCLFDGGVIGSEIFPGNAWQIDAEAMQLRIAADVNRLGHGIDPAIIGKLEDFGYPHAPVFTYQVATLEDRGLFDTGSSDAVTLFTGLMSDDRVRDAMVSDTVVEGRGSEGVSAGGAGAETDLMRFDLDGFRLSGPRTGDAGIGRQPATTRGVPPTLLGLGLLSQYRVILDYPGSRILLDPREAAEELPAHPGFALAHDGTGTRVVQLFQGSPAQRMGLRLGDEVVTIDGRDVSGADLQCETTRWLVEERAAASAGVLTVLRGGALETIVL